MKSVKVEVGFPQCTITQNHRVVSLFDYGPHLSTHPIVSIVIIKVDKKSMFYLHLIFISTKDI